MSTAIRSFQIKNDLGCDVSVSGDSLVDAICGNFLTIARLASLGSAAGFHLVWVTAAYKPGILGGNGGVELRIKHRGLGLAHRIARPGSRIATVWIYAGPEDLPEPHEFDIAGA
jgi:hypothetical protein